LAHLSHLFDGESGIYMDAVHVRDEFTAQISDAVFAAVKNEVDV